MCGNKTSKPPVVPACNFQVNWTSVTKFLIGASDLTRVGTFSYEISDMIPSSAREVLIHATLNSGNSNNEPTQDIKIFTQIGENRYEQYIFSHSYPQMELNTNSDNMWFPMPPNRRVYLTVTTAFRSNAGAQIYVIGYRSNCT